MAEGYRARKDEQKRERREAILAAASELFRTADLNEVSMAQVARKCGLAKGTVFFYFKTKEGLFLALAEQKMEMWHRHFNRLLEASGNDLRRPDDYVDLLEASIREHPDVIRLYTLLDSTLERNVDPETGYRFKRFLKKNLTTSGALMEDRMPFLGEGDGFFLLLSTFVFICGIFPMSNPSGTMKEVLARPGMEVFDVDFAETFRKMMQVFIRGMQRQT